MKRLFALLLVLAMVLGLMPGVFAVEPADIPDTAPLTDEDYVLADLMWEEVNDKEASMLVKKASISHTVEALISTVTSSPYYAEDSLIRNGDHFFWETTDGIPCGYSPRLSATAQAAEAADSYDATKDATILTTSYATRGNSPAGKNVYLFQPYYGLDKDFTEQYVTESKRIAGKLGSTATTYRTTGATVDTIARALEQGAVVIFDSHGDTDYANGDDYVTRANTSYICLQTNAGLTLDDYQKVSGTFGSYYHAYYAGSYNSMKYYCVDGTAIANHMKTSSQGAFLWMALCLSMATDGLHAPLMKKGLAVAYGYSQSVTFEYDYDWEEVFWAQMISGRTVAKAISAMKTQVGLWDWCHARDYDTIAEARKNYCAFPIVVSEQDAYPGHGKVDNLQTVYSSWVLCPHNYKTAITKATCTAEGYTTYTCDLCGYSYRSNTVPATGHSYNSEITPPTCTTEGYTTHTCNVCGHSYTGNQVAALGHSYSAKVTPPTCTAEGYTTHTCNICGHSYTGNTVPKKEHSLTSTTFAPTCTTEGSISYVCLFCDYSYRETSAPALGHSYKDGACSLCGRPDLPENPFADVSEEEYYGYPVLWALKMGITTGTSATTFAPDKACTRAQVVTFLWRAEGSPEPTTTESPFADVSPDAYYYKAVLWAVEQGITQGTGKGRFSPDNPCTRGQVATFLWRAQGQPNPTDSTNPFSDVAPEDYYYHAVLWAVEQGITQGTGKGKFSPDNPCTRGQIVTFLYRALEK